MFAFVSSILPQTPSEVAVILLCGLLILISLLKLMSIGNSNKGEMSTTVEFGSAPLPPGPVSYPLFGNILQLDEALHLTFEKFRKKYGNVFRLKFGQIPVVVLNDYTSLKEALYKQRDIFSGRPVFPSYKLVSFGEGVVFNDRTTQSDWYSRKEYLIRHLHSYVTSTSVRDRLTEHIQVETGFFEDAIRKGCSESSSGYMDPEYFIRVASGNSMCTACFGRRFKPNDAEFARLLSMNVEFGNIIALRSRTDVLPWLTVFPQYYKMKRVFDDLCERMHNWVLNKVEINLETYNPDNTRNLTDALYHGSWRDDKEKAKEAQDNNNKGNVPNIKEYAALVVDIFGAAQDTLSNAYLFIFYYLIRFPEVADNIRKEIAEVVGDNEPLSCSHLHKLPYLEAVLHEVFRHSSMSAVTIPHRVIENTVLQGYKIAKDTVVFLNFYSANHDPDAWDDPDTFSPDRFLKRTDDGSRKIDSSKARKYLVFSAGPRKCPGGDFTRMWLSLSMAILLQKYHFVPDPQCQPTEISTFGLTLKPSTFKIKLVPRDHATNVEYR